MKNYSAIILAAGYSSRMGSFKPLMDLYGKTPVERNIELFKSCGIKNIIVVTGYLSELVEEKYKNECSIIHNEDFNKGMYSSIKKGVNKIPLDTDGFFVIPCDIPSVRPFTIKKLMESFEKSEKDIFYPVFNGEKGHPVLVPYFLGEKIVCSNPKRGLMDILSMYIKHWRMIEVCDRGILLDMDTKEEFEILKKHMKAQESPDFFECMEILKLSSVREDTKAHMQEVGRLSLELSKILNSKGEKLDENAIYAGALLHDVKKGTKNHGEEGAKLVETYGYGCLYEIISQHMNLKTNNKLGNKEIVYLCDKLIKGTSRVSLEDRFKKSLELYKDNPIILKEVRRKLNDAIVIKKAVEEVIGYNLESLR